VGAGASFLQMRSAPGVPRPRLLRELGRLPAHFGLQFVVTTGVAQLSLYLLGLVSTVEAIGAVRGVQLLFAPLGVLYLGALVTLLPRNRRDDRGRGRLALGASSVALAGVAAAAIAVYAALPASVGEALLGDTWVPAADLVPSYGSYMVAMAVAAGATVGLMASDRPRDLSLLRLGFAVPLLLAPLAGASIGDAKGFTVALAVVGAALAVSSWWLFLARTRRSVPGSGDATQTSADR